jgi:hypothetical protein
LSKPLWRRAAAEQFWVSAASAVRFVSERRQNGATSAKPQGGDQRSHRIEAYREMILSSIKAKPEMTLVEIAECSKPMRELRLRRARFGALSFKNAHAAGQDRPDVTAAREARLELAPRLDPDKPVFIEEASASTLDQDGPPLWPLQARQPLLRLRSRTVTG